MNMLETFVPQGLRWLVGVLCVGLLRCTLESSDPPSVADGADAAPLTDASAGQSVCSEPVDGGCPSGCYPFRVYRFSPDDMCLIDEVFACHDMPGGQTESVCLVSDEGELHRFPYAIEIEDWQACNDDQWTLVTSSPRCD